MTAVEWFAKEILSYKNPTNISGTDYILIPINKVDFLETKAKQMEKEQHQISFNKGYDRRSYIHDLEYGGAEYWLEEPKEFEQYYTKTYGSKGSDDKFDVLKEMFELEQQLDIPNHMRWHNKTSSQTEISEPNPQLIESMCYRYRHDFGFLKDNHKESIRTTMKQLWEEVVGKGFYKQTEISDEEIIKKAIEVGFTNTLFIDGAKWYREQLKKK